MKELRIGINAQSCEIVDNNKLAKAVGSGSLEVFATPMMIALMENAAAKSLDPYLENGETTVGTYVNVNHISATPVGMKVKAYAEVIKIDGRAVTFNVKAEDESGIIGEGTHKRFIVESEKFMKKITNKKN